MTTVLGGAVLLMALTGFMLLISAAAAWRQDVRDRKIMERAGNVTLRLVVRENGFTIHRPGEETLHDSDFDQAKAKQLRNDFIHGRIDHAGLLAELTRAQAEAPVPRPGRMLGIACALLPGAQGQDCFDEALDHLACVVEERGNVRRARRDLVCTVIMLVPVAWYREIRRRVLRRA